jgi:hypothetical protein
MNVFFGRHGPIRLHLHLVQFISGKAFAENLFRSPPWTWWIRIYTHILMSKTAALQLGKETFHRVLTLHWESFPIQRKYLLYSVRPLRWVNWIFHLNFIHSQWAKQDINILKLQTNTFLRYWWQSFFVRRKTFLHYANGSKTSMSFYRCKSITCHVLILRPFCESLIATSCTLIFETQACVCPPPSPPKLHKPHKRFTEKQEGILHDCSQNQWFYSIITDNIKASAYFVTVT